MSLQQDVQVRVARRFTASAERVFDAWLEPAMIGQWMCGPGVRNEEIVRLSLDARVGGRFSFVVRRQGQDIDHVGTYLELDRPRRLVFTWAIAENLKDEAQDNSRVSIDIVPLAAGCELTLTHAMHPKWAGYADRTQAGWTTMLEALGRVLEPSTHAAPARRQP
jgi:uncharacterized protein YndB with AHSA1/START domain